ncbi:MAG: 4Fe-4S binding protein [Dysgonamonadaceae bacterium]|jgi:polyferredoxin/Na+-translocating ferredoxin:NAD+ oxidoreductase RNF subunit RnfB|nr:4Fe-4S binding protein [Dysgonamonadaceae bacterium]
MKSNPFKLIRVILALLVFLPVLLFFCDFAGIFPDSFSKGMRIQFVPAILSGSLWIVLSLIVITLLFGRIYCSVICPLGILQDITAWFTKRGKKKNRKKRWYHYHKPYAVLRYTLLSICVLFLLFGITTPLLLLDPYSNFGRIAVNLFRPLVMEGNNLLNWIALKFNNYDFYHVTIYTITGLSLAVSLLALLTVGILAFLRGRLFCNTICPVGSFLGLLSKGSVFRIGMNDALCNSCGLCEKACKSQCVNSKEKKIDASRCVTCFNCLDRCTKKGIGYRFAYTKPEVQLKQQTGEKQTIKEMLAKPKQGLSRRSFMLASGALAATLPFIPAWAKSDKELDVTKLRPITPPGSKSLAHFKEHCTACHLCITHCPQQILKPAGFNFGLNYAFKPHLVFYEMAFCNFECTVCSEICPNGAIERLTTEEKKVTQVGIAQFEKTRCVVFTDNTSCGACSEHCPVQAVKMEAYGDTGLTLPHVYEEMCIGCGGCESICPVRPVKAINVLANEIHQTALKPEEEEIKEIDHEELDFGF